MADPSLLVNLLKPNVSLDIKDSEKKSVQNFAVPIKYSYGDSLSTIIISPH
jgi:hypothetical protein